MTVKTRSSQRKPPSPSTLFVRLWNSVASRQDAEVRENFFSECVSGVLNADAALTKAFVRSLNQGRDRIAGTSISRAPVRVIPQYTCDSNGRRCFVDLRIDVGSNLRIGVETKLDAPEGSHSSGDRQLVKYLGIRSLTHIAFVTANASKVEKKVLRSKKRYLRPPGKRQHFLWSDFYPSIRAAAQRRTAPHLAQALLELFHARHLEPAHPDLPDFGTPEGRAQFRPLWGATRVALLKKYEHVARPKITGTMMSWNTHGRGAWKMELSPALYPGVLRIWLYMENRKSRDKTVQNLVRLFESRGGPFRGATAEPRQGKGYSSWGINVFIPYRSIFPRRSSDQSKQKRLALVVKSVVSATE